MRHRLLTLFSLTLIVAVAVGAAAQDRRNTRGFAGGHKYGQSTPRPKARGTVRIATYNLLNLFDHIDDPNLTGDIDDMLLAASPERCAKLAEAIRATDADIIALQEVESLEALLWFRDNWLKDAGYEHVVSVDVGYYRGVECSVLSRFEITGYRTWPDVSLDNLPKPGLGWAKVPQDKQRGLKYQRSPLMVDVRIRDDYELTVFTLHHKAGNHKYHREAEAISTMRIVNELQKRDPSRNIIVMGDFNAAPWDKSLRHYLENGLIDSLAHRNIPPKSLPQEESWLYKTHESDRVLDYMLLNSALHREFVVGSAHVYGTLTPPSSYNWREDPQPKGYASDHYPVMLDIRPRDLK